MNKPYFCRNFFLIDWCHKSLKNTIDLLLFYGEHFCGFSESDWYAYLQTSKIFIPFLKHLTQNEYTVMDLFHFGEEYCKQDPSLYTASLDVDSLFTNVLLNETIDISIHRLYKDDENTTKIPKDVFCNLFTMAIKESFFCLTTNFINKLMVLLRGLH